MLASHVAHCDNPPAIVRSHYRPDGTETSDTKRRRLKQRLMTHDPHCLACGCELTEMQGQPNSAHLVLQGLSCPDHIKLVRVSFRTGDAGAIERIQRKGREYLTAHRPPDPVVSIWLVDGIPFTSEQAAVGAAERLSEEIGSTLEIFAASMPRTAFRRTQIVKPTGNQGRKTSDAEANAWNEYADRKNAEFARTIRKPR